MLTNENLYYLLCSYSWEKSCSWDIGQNILSQSVCWIFKSSIYQWDFFAYWCKFTKVQSCWKIFLVGHGQNIGVANLVSGLLKLMELTDFLHTVTNSRKFKYDWKFLGWTYPKLDMTSLVMGSKIDCIWRMNRGNKLTFCVLIQVHRN